jgi:hypothetical protein
MRKGLIICILITLSISVCGYVYYQYKYVETLMLSEIVGHSEDPMINIFVNLVDFDTGLTRNDIKELKSNKEQWINRINEVETIYDPDLRGEASAKLLSEMMEDPILKKQV